MTPRGTAALVARLRRDLGERDLAVLDSLQRVRLLTTDQIRRLHFAENAVRAQSRRTRELLRRLHGLKLIVRLGRQIGGIKAGSSGYVFGLTGLGLSVLDVPIGQRRRRTVWEAKPYFQDHMLAVSELYVRLVETSRASDTDLLAFDAEPACWRRFTGSGGEPITLKPDAFVRVGIGDYELASFVEIDLGTESLPTIRRKCQVFLSYWRSGVEQQRHGVFPRVVWLVPDQHRVDGIAGVLTRFTRDALGALFTVAQVEHGADLLTTLPADGGGGS
jgi:hypothetical protein